MYMCYTKLMCVCTQLSHDIVGVSHAIYGILTLGACTLDTVAKTLIIATTFLAQLTGELSTDEAGDSGFISTLRVVHVCSAAMPCAFLWYPLTLWLAKLICMHAVLRLTQVSNLQSIIVDMQCCSVYFNLAPRFAS